MLKMNKNPQKNFRVSFWEGGHRYYINITSTTKDGARKKCITRYPEETVEISKVEELDNVEDMYILHQI